jgi:hypothetical protein
MNTLAHLTIFCAGVGVGAGLSLGSRSGSSKATDSTSSDATVLIDFDQMSGFSPAQVSSLIDGITQRLAKQLDLNPSRISFIAVGNKHAFLGGGGDKKDEARLIQLRNMSVHCVLVPSHKKEEADRWLERILVTKRMNDVAPKAVVIVSDDQDFVPVVKALRAGGTKVFWQTTYDTGNAFANMRRYATDVWSVPHPSAPAPALVSKL